MDFTYFFAGAIAIVVGFVAASIFVVLKGGSTKWLLLIAIVVAVLLDSALLINWRALDSHSPVWLLLDAAFFGIYSLIGCSVGILPPLAVRWLWRKFVSAPTQ